MARLQALAAPLSALLVATTQIPADRPHFHLVDAKPLPIQHRLRHGRVRLLHEEGARFGKMSQGFLSFGSSADRVGSCWTFPIPLMAERRKKIDDLKKDHAKTDWKGKSSLPTAGKKSILM